MKGRVRTGRYALLTVPSGSFAGKTFSLSLVDATGTGVSAHLDVSDTVLSLDVRSNGLTVILR